MSDFPRNRNDDSDAFGDGMHWTGESELAAVGRAVRSVYVEELDPDVTEGHLAAILAEAERVAAAGADRTAVRPAARPWLGRRASLALRLATVVASAVVASAGLAIAGVRPPEPFSDVFEGLGFDVPGSDESSPGNGPASEPAQAPTASGPSVDAVSADLTAQGNEDRHVQAAERGDPAVGQSTETSSDGRDTSTETQGEGGPPGELDGGEDNASTPEDPSSQGQAQTNGSPETTPDGPPDQVESGQGHSGSDGEGLPEPLVDPGDGADSEAPGGGTDRDEEAVPRGIIESEGHRPADEPEERWAEPTEEPEPERAD